MAILHQHAILSGKREPESGGKKVQLERWRALEIEHGHRTAHASRSKPQWGLEESLYQMPSVAVVTYIKVRNGAGIHSSHMSAGRCAKCGKQAQSEAHLLWACESTSKARGDFHTAAKMEAPSVWQGLTRLAPQEAFHYLMGAGAREASKGEWAKFQCAAVGFVEKVFGVRDRE